MKQYLYIVWGKEKAIGYLNSEEMHDKNLPQRNKVSTSHHIS